MTGHRTIDAAPAPAAPRAASVLSPAGEGRAVLAVPIGAGGTVSTTAVAEVAEHVGPLSPGERVLAVGTPGEALFVIARLAGRDGNAAPAPAGPVEARHATVADADGEPLVTVDRMTRAVTIHAAAGDLSLAAPAGRVVIAARDGIALRGGESVAVEARQVSAFSESLAVTASDAAVSATTARVGLGRLTLTARSVRQTVDSLLTVGRRLVEKVRGKREIDADTIRLVAPGDVDMDAGRVSVRSRGDVVVGGERIHLG